MAAESGQGRGRRSRGRLAAIAVCATVLLLVAAAYVYAQARSSTIADGVRVAGVQVGGMDRSAATARVEVALRRRLAAGVPVDYRGQSWTLHAGDPSLNERVEEAVGRALATGSEGSFLSRAERGLLGESVNASIPVAVAVPHQALDSFASQVASAVDSQPVDASVTPSGEALTAIHGKNGVSVREHELEERIRSWLAAGGGAAVSVPVQTVKPQVTLADLANRYPAYIVVDREQFRLRFYNHLKLERTYEIAVGMQGLETPSGLYHIQWEQVNPPWYVPNSAWAGALAGKVIPPGPQDPLKARFMSFDGGAGIHGIDPSEYWSIGHNASHGCVRMRIPDVISLYAKSPVGTPVYIY